MTKIDIDQIMLGDDLSTNYQLMPGDRLVVQRIENLTQGSKEATPRPSTPVQRPIGDSPHFNRQPTFTDKAAGPDSKERDGREDRPALLRIEKRMNDLEHKLDMILDAIKRPEP